MKQYKNCQNCGKPIEGGKFCSPECGQIYHQKPVGAKPLKVSSQNREQKRIQQNKHIDDIRLKRQLNDTQQQRGLTWRKAKVNAVAEARRKGYSERAIFVELKKAGLTNHTANSIMDDAWYFSEEPDS